MKKLSILLIFVLSFKNVNAQLTTDTLLSQAYQKAEKENKKVFVIFSSSWCHWCHTMINKMKERKNKIYFDREYVVVILSVMDREKTTPGADSLLKKYNGENAGIPFWLIFDNNGKLLQDSYAIAENGKPENIACPVKENIVNFCQKIKATSNMNDDEIAVLRRSFKKIKG